MVEHSAEPRTTLSAEKARAGETSGRIRRVLLISLSGAVIALAIAYALWNSMR